MAEHFPAPNFSDESKGVKRLRSGWPEHRPRSKKDEAQLLAELWELAKSNPLTENVHDILLHPSLPVDIRHNAKIFREKLAVWAEEKLRRIALRHD
jgi:hypothetical protein